MTSSNGEWLLSEKPAIDLLGLLGYDFIDPKDLEKERFSARSWLLPGRIEAAVKKLNPWIDDDNARSVVRSITTHGMASLLEANETLHTAITYGVSVEQTVDGVKRNRRVQFIDWANPGNNDFIVTNQVKVEGKGGYNPKPDIALLVNGIPFVVIECKDPALKGGPINKALEDLQKYQRFAPTLFEPNMAVVGMAGAAGAKYGMVAADPRYYSNWKDPYPLTRAELSAKTGRQYADGEHHQDVLVAGLLAPANLLEILRYYVVFDREDGAVIKKMARYHQFRAVDKAIQRLKANDKADKRGGTVWHTQGSGKSLTMIFLAGKMRSQDVGLNNPLIVVVTDRRELDKQITAKFKSAGYDDTPIRANTIKHLKQLLQQESGTVMTTLHKFQDLLGEEKGELNGSRDIYLLVDEAHRSQYGLLAAQMRGALPKAVYFGFTGTPLDKKEKKTTATFGSYVDVYSREDSVADGNTLEVTYDPRLPTLNIEKADLKQMFRMAFSDYTDEERDAIIKRYGTMEAVAGSRSRVRQVCMDLLKHYREEIEPNGYKAMVVACNKETAALYEKTLRELGAPETALILSPWTKGDPDHLRQVILETSEQEALVERFKKKDNPLKILVVCNKLLTGFDAPILQALYVDRPLKDHTLLQALDRTNRPHPDKYKGIVVDYWGITKNMEKALNAFEPTDVKDVWKPKQKEKDLLKVACQEAMAFFQGTDPDDIEACARVLAPEDVCVEFEAAAQRFLKVMDFMLPDPAALVYKAEAEFLGRVRELAHNMFGDERMNLAGCRAKVRALIEEHVRGRGVVPLMEPILITAPDAAKRIQQLDSDESRALAMRHALKREISVRQHDNPGIYQELDERIEEIIRKRQQQRITEIQEFELYQQIAEEIMNMPRRAQQLGLTEDAFAIHELLSRAEKFPGDPVATAKAVMEPINEGASYTDWEVKEGVQKEMRARVKKILVEQGMDWSDSSALAAAIVQLARQRLAP